MHTRVHGRERRLRRDLRGRQRSSCYKGCVGKKQRPGREAPLLMPIVAPPGDSFPSDFPTPRSRAVSCGFAPRPSSVLLPAVFLHTPVPIPCLVVHHPGSHPCLWPHPVSHHPTVHRPHPRAPHPSPHPATLHPCSPLCRPTVPIHAPAVVERGRYFMVRHSVWCERVMRGDRAVTVGPPLWCVCV